MSGSTMAIIIVVFVVLAVGGMIIDEAKKAGQRHAERTKQDPAPIVEKYEMRAASAFFGTSAIIALIIYANWHTPAPEATAATSTPGSVSPKVTLEADGYTQEDVTKAIEAFRKACKPLGDNSMWSDVVEIRARISKEYATYRLVRGWKSGLHLELVLPNELRNVPMHNPETGVIAGHTLHYFLGGGATPGFFAKKRVSQFLCGLPVAQSGRDMFMDVPDLALLNREPVQPDPGLSKMLAAAAEAGENNPGYSPAALQCDTKRSTCLNVCFEKTGSVEKNTPTNSPKRRCRNACHDGYFNCRQALDKEWRTGPELIQCDAKRLECRASCELAKSIPDSCLPGCESGYELCRKGEGYWINSANSRERVN